MSPLILVGGMLLVLTSPITANSGSYSPSPSAATSGNGVQDYFATIPANVKFWWAGPNSPFALAYEAFKRCPPGQECSAPTWDYSQQFLEKLKQSLPTNGCTSNTCGYSGTVNFNNQKAPSGGTVHYSASGAKVDISQNPFLNGQIPIEATVPTSTSCGNKPGSSCSNSGSTTYNSGSTTYNTGSAPMDLSKNPFLTGQIQVTSGGSTYQPKPTYPTQSSGCGSNNCGGSQQTYQPSPTYPTQPSGCGSNNCGGSQPTYQPQPTFQPQPGSACGNNGCSGGSNVNLQNNPFLGGNYQPNSNAPVQPTQSKPIDLNSNPFFNKPQTTQGFPTNPPGGFPTNPPQAFPTSYPGKLNPGYYAETTENGENPTTFTYQPFPTVHPGKVNPGILGQAGGVGGQVKGSDGEDELRITCASAGYICVEKAYCVNGVVEKYFGEGLLQARSSAAQFCKVGSEECCRLSSAPRTNTPVRQVSAGSYQTVGFSNSDNEVPQASVGTPITTNYINNLRDNQQYVPEGLVHVAPAAGDSTFAATEFVGSSKRGPQYLPPGPSFVPTEKVPDLLPPYDGDGTNPAESFQPYPTTQRPYVPPPTTRPPPPPIYTTPRSIPTTTRKVNNGYLPPIGPDGSNVDYTKVPPPTKKPPPKEPNYKPSPTDDNPSIIRPAIKINSGCAAALKCVKIEYCTADGIISNSTVYLTKEQNDLRVPLSDCLEAESQTVGKCCRDPTYVDPWPVGQLGLWNPNDGHDDGSYKADNAGRYTGDNSQPTFIPRPPPPPRPVATFQGDNFVAPSSSYGSCGIRHPESRPPGNGPFDTAFGEIPWQAMVLRDANRSLLCGGAIIRDNVVLTAAHCVEGLPANDVLVKGGEWRLGIDEEPKPFQIVKVAAILIHPQYTPETLFNDIALLILEEKFRLDTHISPLCTPLDNEDIENKYASATCILTGWGKEVLRINIQNALMHRLETNFIQPSQCEAQISNNHPADLYRYNPNSCICSQSKIEKYDVCDVDPGSALACDVGGGQYILAGIYSWDTGCKSRDQIASLVRLDVKWINVQLNKPYNQLVQASNTKYNVAPFPQQQQQQQYQANHLGSASYQNYQKTNPVFQHQRQHAEGEPCDCNQG